MKTEFKTKANAQRAFNRKKKKMEEKMCPVFKTFCLTDKCMSFAGSVYMRKNYNKPDIYLIHSPCCTSSFVTGYIEAEMTHF